MIIPKKRTLNEIRQTKDNFYVVPEQKKIDDSQQLFKDFFIETNNINSNNYCKIEMFKFLNVYVLITNKKICQ